MKTNGPTTKIINNNCTGLCSQKYCANKYTEFAEIEIAGLPILITFCEKHAKQYNEGWANE